MNRYNSKITYYGKKPDFNSDVRAFENRFKPCNYSLVGKVKMSVQKAVYNIPYYICICTYINWKHIYLQLAI